MLKGIDPISNADVLQALRAKGHGEDLIIADTNFPSDSVARETVLGQVLRIDRPAAQVVRAVLSLYPIDSFVDDAAARMEVVGEPETILPVMQEVQTQVSAVQGPTMIGIERYAFMNGPNRPMRSSRPASVGFPAVLRFAKVLCHQKRIE